MFLKGKTTSEQNKCFHLPLLNSVKNSKEKKYEISPITEEEWEDLTQKEKTSVYPA